MSVRRSLVHGRGLFATRGFTIGEFVCEYAGEKITHGEALRRHQLKGVKSGHDFYLDVGGGRIIDGAVGGNCARWINHSCIPNCVPVDKKGSTFIRAARNISAGEELNVDYELYVVVPPRTPYRQFFVCRCGSSQCRGSLFGEVGKHDLSSSTSRWTSNPVAKLVKESRPLVRVLEWPVRNKLIISWREAGRCCYCEQEWARTVALTAGVCALSGDAYRPGDAVFEPTGQPAPTNRLARISEASVRYVVELEDALI